MTRFLLPFALPGKPVECQLSWGTLRRESATGWFGSSLAPFSKHNERFARRYRYSTKNSPDVALLKLSSPYVGSWKYEHTIHIQKHIHIRAQISLYRKYLYCWTYVIMNCQGHNNIRNGIVSVQTGHSTCTCTVSLHVVELWTHQKFESFKKIFRDDEIRIRIC